jgi:hypothetical protein
MSSIKNIIPKSSQQTKVGARIFVVLQMKRTPGKNPCQPSLQTGIMLQNTLCQKHLIDIVPQYHPYSLIRKKSSYYYQWNGHHQ